MHPGQFLPGFGNCRMIHDTYPLSMAPIRLNGRHFFAPHKTVLFFHMPDLGMTAVENTCGMANRYICVIGKPALQPSAHHKLLWNDMLLFLYFSQNLSQAQFDFFFSFYISRTVFPFEFCCNTYYIVKNFQKRAVIESGLKDICANSRDCTAFLMMLNALLFMFCAISPKSHFSLSF